MNNFHEILSCDFDLIIFTETQLNKSVLNSEICDQNNYIIYRRDRNDPLKSDGSGDIILVAAKIKSNFNNPYAPLPKIYG